MGTKTMVNDLGFQRAPTSWPRGLVVVTGDLEAEALSRGLTRRSLAIACGHSAATVGRAAKGAPIRLQTMRSILIVLAATPPLSGNNGQTEEAP